MTRAVMLFFYIACAMVLFTGCTGHTEELDRLAGDVYSRSIIPEPKPSRPFKSDGCSWFPDGNWVECCVIHDLAYWRGGTRDERKAADIALERCVTGYGHPKTAFIMYLGVRIGGAWWLPTSFRWGFGWDYPQSGPPNVPY